MDGTPWNPYETPPTGEPRRGRWELRTTPAGWTSAPDETMALVAKNLAEDRLRETPEREPERVSVPLFYAKPVEGTWTLVERGTVAGTPTRAPVELPAKAKRGGYRPAELLERFLLGDTSVYGALRDSAIWEALLRYVERGHLRGRALRDLQDAVARLVCLRHGLVVSTDALPCEMLR
jgi:hypothetical protein